ncbi:MAG: GNAT family N-acetyltransferase [Chloroflexota bacterium]
MLKLQEVSIQYSDNVTETRPSQPDNLPSLVDTHIMEVQSWLGTRAPNAQRFEETGFKAVSSGLDVPLLNLVLGCRSPIGISNESIGYHIELIREFFAERGVAWSWWIGPSPTPVNIGQHLERHGLHPVSSRPAMVASLSAAQSASPSGISVWQARSLLDLEAASTIRRIAFCFPYGTALNYFESMADDWLNSDNVRLFLARAGDGAPAAMGALITGAGMPGVYAMATLPEWSRRGLGTAILHRIMSEAAADGHQFIALTASRYGYPLYQRVGFEHIFDYTIYRDLSGF